VFQFDKEYEENEKQWNLIKAEILGETVNPNNAEEEQEEEDEELNAELQKQEENKNVFLGYLKLEKPNFQPFLFNCNF
jgi:hypothetical protein